MRQDVRDFCEKNYGKSGRIDPDNECPVADPDCLSNDDECHDACKAPLLCEYCREPIELFISETMIGALNVREDFYIHVATGRAPCRSPLMPPRAGPFVSRYLALVEFVKMVADLGDVYDDDAKATLDDIINQAKALRGGGNYE